ncbi:hypothetical protein NIES3974_27350 [Calothrix sp. NIES-3974]|nr:hypothetical protein NIES3974_27350 [Calothrix sp. NIES-3974]
METTDDKLLSNIVKTEHICYCNSQLNPYWQERVHQFLMRIAN